MVTQVLQSPSQTNSVFCSCPVIPAISLSSFSPHHCPTPLLLPYHFTLVLYLFLCLGFPRNPLRLYCAVLISSIVLHSFSLCISTCLIRSCCHVPKDEIDQRRQSFQDWNSVHMWGVHWSLLVSEDARLKLSFMTLLSLFLLQHCTPFNYARCNFVKILVLGYLTILYRILSDKWLAF